eukprot:379251_1
MGATVDCIPSNDEITSNNNNNDIIEQLIALNIGDRKDILDAMKNVINPNDINEISEYLTNQMMDTSEIISIIDIDNDDYKKKEKLKYIITSYSGSYCTSHQELSSSLVSVLPIGTIVIVEEIINDKQCRISSPNNGWIPLNDIDELKHYKNQILSLSDAYYYLSYNELKQLKVNDKIDHCKWGHFYPATILEIDKTNKSRMRICYDDVDASSDIWTDFNVELYRFARYNTISQNKILNHQYDKVLQIHIQSSNNDFNNIYQRFICCMNHVQNYILPIFQEKFNDRQYIIDYLYWMYRKLYNKIICNDLKNLLKNEIELNKIINIFNKTYLNILNEFACNYDIKHLNFNDKDIKK